MTAPQSGIYLGVFDWVRAHRLRGEDRALLLGVRMFRTPLRSSTKFMIVPPGKPKTRSTPSAHRPSSTICESLRVHDFGLGFLSGLGFLRVLVQPRHHAAQPGTDFFDGVLLLGVAQGKNFLPPALFSSIHSGAKVPS